MAAARDTKHIEALDQLQKEVNVTLENIGRLFAAAQNGSKGSAAARALRLKRDMPGSINRYHAALDVLDEELQSAKAVMRRDLAVCREQSGVQMSKPAVRVPEPQAEVTNENIRHFEDQKAAPAPNMVSPEQIQDEKDQSSALPPPTNTSEVPEAPAQTTITSSKPSPNGAVDAKAPITPPTAPKDESSTDQAPALDNNDPATNKLSVDTKAVPPAEEKADIKMDDQAEADPPTAVTETADLESLFNDPASASANGVSAPGSGPATMVSEAQDQDFTSGFDFGSFNASLSKPGTGSNDDLDLGTGDDNDLSALLPGVQDYANMQPENGMEGLDLGMGTGMDMAGMQSMEQPNFDELFAADGPGDMMGGGDGIQGMGGVGDSTFDDLMDFSNFGSGGGDDFTTGEGGDKDNNNQEFDFNFS